MAMKSFVVEGDVTLAYFVGGEMSRHVLLETPETLAQVQGPATSNRPEPVRLETYIAQQLGFPNQEEFDAVYKLIDDLRQKGLQLAPDEPACARETMKMRITVEVL